MADELKKFGKYFLLDHMTQGGFADIYRARLATPEGASRIIVIKRIQAGYDANSEFIQMFRSETKTSMALNHPNIVQVFDVGEEQGQPYIAMELVHGRNLRQILTRFGEQQKNLPVFLAAHIIEQAARALAYAHEFRDNLTGQALNLVHRDISPQNIMVSYEGNVKLIDFGIAKATTNSEHTRTGVIKGKPSYFSPEQINGDELDGRSDLFALGIVMWELLTGRKLFAGESDIAIIKMIEECNSKVVPPSKYNAQIPKALDNIVLKALQRDREHRFQRSAELQRELQKFIQEYDPGFQSSELMTEMRSMFHELIDEDQRGLKLLNEKAEILIQNLAREPSPAGRGPAPVRGPVQNNKAPPPKEVRPTTNRTIEASMEDQKIRIELDPRNPHGGRNTRDIHPPRRPTTTSHLTQAGRGRRTSQGLQKFLGFAAAAGALLLIATRLGVHIPVVSQFTDAIFEAQTASLTIRGGGEITAIYINDQPFGSIPQGTRLPYTAVGIPAGKPVRVRVVGSWGEDPPRTLTLEPGKPETITLLADSLDSGEPNRLPSGDQSDATVGNQPQPSTAESLDNNVDGNHLTLSFRIYPNGKGTLIRVNGQEFTADTPSIKVMRTHDYTIQVQRPGWKATEGGFDLPKVLELRGMIQFALTPLDGTLHGNLHVTNRQGWDITISNVSTGELIHRDRIDQDEKLYPLPTGTYQISLRDSGTGTQLEPQVINITNSSRTELP